MVKTKQKTIRELREALGLSQEALAKQADVSRALISLLEIGQRDVSKLSLDSARRLANALHIELSELF